MSRTRPITDPAQKANINMAGGSGELPLSAPKKRRNMYGTNRVRKAKNVIQPQSRKERSLKIDTSIMATQMPEIVQIAHYSLVQLRMYKIVHRT